MHFCITISVMSSLPPPKVPRQKVWRDASPAAQPNQSVIAAVEVLMALSVASGAVGSHELSRALGWNVMRANRVLKTLAQTGLARRTDKGKYIAGAGLVVMSAQALHGSALVRAARTVIGSAGFPNPLAIGVLWQGQVCYLFHQSSAGGAPLLLGSHPPYDARKSSLGRLLMALRGDRGPGMAEIRSRKYCHVVQDRSRNEGSLAVPLGTTGAALGATNVLTATQAKQLLPALRRLAEQIVALADE